MKYLDKIADAIGYEIIAYNGWYELDKLNGNTGYICNTLMDVAEQLAELIERDVKK